MNFKLLLISCTASFFLTGCYQVANNTDLRKAEAFCGGLENVEGIAIWFNSRETVRCMNTTTEHTHLIPLTPSKKSDTLQPEVQN